MLINLSEILKDAKKNKYGVGFFNAISLEMAKATIEAAEELNAPVIVGTAEILLEYGSIEEIGGILLPLAKKSKVPVAIHYDHGLTKEKTIEALKCGYTSVMYDCSTLSNYENAKAVKEMVEIAKVFGATVEAELGHVGANVDCIGAKDGNEGYFTEPSEAKEFVENSNCDALAVSVGSAHGAYKNPPKIQLERLKEIASNVDIPLVLHGGSGLSDDDFRNCIANGIQKINVFTDIDIVNAKAMHDFYKEGCAISSMLIPVRQAIKEAVMKKMIIFGCENRA